MKRVTQILILLFLLLLLGTQEGCVKFTCKRGIKHGTLVIKYPNLPKRPYNITLIRTANANINAVVDTIHYTLIGVDSNLYILMSQFSYTWFEIDLKTDSLSNEFADTSKSIYLHLESVTPPSLIIIIDSLRRDTISHIRLIQKGAKSTCHPEDVVAVQFIFNGQFVSKETQTFFYEVK